ncbi:mucin-4 isoform X1 [Choloepus didactylus]|uniref:mucin-4 isoform X1 n=1 Tax=Choloepus didactylus TaxID=27675 RepID=UPI0018A02AC6|nr:mucin-4 isoform X1 [Choloepus didactylus]
MGQTLSPSSPIATFSSSPDRESHTPQTATSVFPTGSTEGPPVVSSGIVSDVPSHSPATMWSTSGEVLPRSTSFSDTRANVTAVHPVGSESVSLTETAQVPSSSVGVSRKTATRHPVTVQSVAPATDPITSPTYVSSTSHPISTAGSTHTSSDETASHSSPRTTVMTASGTSTSQPTTSHAVTLTPSSAVSSSSVTDAATELGSSPLSPVTTQGNGGDVSPTVSGRSTSDASATAEPTRQSTPSSASTSPAEPAAVTQMSNTQGAHATQESQTSRSGFPSTNTIRTVTAPTPLPYPSGQSASESVPLNTPTASSPTPSGRSHATWASTTEEGAPPMSPDTTLGISGDASLSPTGTIAQVTSVVSDSVGSGREATSPSSGTSPDAKSAVSQTHQPQGTETTGAPHTGKWASLLPETTWEGTRAPSSFTILRQASSGSPPPEKFTSGETAPLTTTLSGDSHTTPTTAELLSSATTLDTTPETIFPKGTTPTISEASTTGRPTGQSISTSFSTPSQESPSISQITQTKGTGTISGSETVSSVSRVTDTFPTAISSPPSSAPNVYTSPQAMGHTLSPSTPVSDGHTPQTGMPNLATGSTEGPPAVTSGPLSDVTSHFSTMQSTSGEVLPASTSFSDIRDHVTTAHPVGSEGVSLTETAQVPSSSVGISDEPTTGRPVAVRSVASATNPTTSPTYVSPTSNPTGTAGTTLTLSDEPTFHSSPRPSPMTTPDTSTSPPTTTYTFTPTPTLAVSPSGDADTATALWSSPISPVTTQGKLRDISPTVSGSSTSNASTTAESTRQSTPLSTNTSPVETGTVSQMTHTQGAQATQQPRTSRSAFPNTDTIGTVTATAPSPYPSGHSSSESLPLDTATTDAVTVSTSVPSGMSHTTQAPTVEEWASPTSLDTTLGMSGDTSLSPTSTIAQVPSVSSVSGGPGGQATSSSSATSPDATSAISLTQESRGRETTAVPHTSKSASLLTDKAWVGTTATSSSTITSQTSSGSPLPEGFTSGKTVAFKPTLSSDSHTTPSTTELFSDANILHATQGTKGNVSPTFRSDISPTISEASTTGRPTGESISTSFSTSSQETPSVSQEAQTEGVGTISRSETISSVSRVADSFPTAIASPPSSTPNGHSSPESMGQTLSPSSPIATFSSSPDRESHTPQTATSVFPTGSTEGPPVVSSGIVSDVPSHSPATMWSTSGEVLPRSTSFSDTRANVTAVHPVGSESVSLTETAQVPSSSVGVSRKTATRHPVTVQSVAPATDPITSPTYVSSTSHPISTAGSTHTSSDETASHSSPRTTVMTASGTSTSQPTTSHAVTLTPSSAVSSSSVTDAATELGSSPLSPVTTQGNGGDVSPTVSGRSTSDASATAEPTRQSTPSSASTSPAEPAAVTQMSNTQGAHATQESQTSRSGFPSTNTIRTVTAPTPLPYPSGQSASESVPLNTPTASSPTPSGRSHATWASTTEEGAPPMSPNTTLGISGDASLSPTGTIAQVTSVVSDSVGSGREATSPSSGTSPDAKSAVSQTHQPQGTETTGAPHTGKWASLLPETTWEGTRAPSSFTILRQASSGSPPPEKFTSGETAPLTTTLSGDSHTTPTTAELLSSATTLDTTPETIFPKGTTPTISEASTTGRPTGQSISTSFSTPSQESPSISQITQTKGTGTISGSETVSSVSRVTDTFPTAISSPPSSAPNVYTSPQAMGHTLSPSTPVSDGHTPQTGMPNLATGSTEGPPAVTSGPLSDVTSHFSTMQSTSGEVLPASTSFSDIRDHVTTAHPVGSEGVSLTETAQVPSSSVGISDEPTTGRPVAVRSVASATNPTTSPTYVSPTSNPTGTAGTTLTRSDEPTFHSSPRPSPMTTPDTSTSPPTTTYTFTPTPTLAVSPSGDADTATALWSSPISPVTTQGKLRDISPTVSGSSTSNASTTAESTRQSTPLSTNTSPVETGTVSQMTHTQGSQATQQPRTSRSAFPNTDTIGTVTATAPSPYPSGHSSSESLPLDTATTDAVTVSTSVPSGMSHTTQAPTVEEWASPTSLDTTLGMSGDTSLSPTSTIAQVPSVSSVSGGPGGQATSSSSATSPDATSAISLTQESRGRETTAVPHTSKSASLLTDKAWVGTTATSSSTITSQTSSGSPLPEGFTSGMITASLRTDSKRSTAAPLPLTASGTLKTSTPSTSTFTHSKDPPVPIKPEKVHR